MTRSVEERGAAPSAVADERTQLRRNSVGLAGVVGWPTNLVIGLFLGLTVGTTVTYLVLRQRRPSALAGIGNSVDVGSDEG